MSKKRWIGAGALVVCTAAGIGGAGADTAQAQTLSGFGVVADTKTGKGALIRSGPSTKNTDVIGGIGEGKSAKALCYVTGEKVAGHIRTTNRWVLVGDGFSSGSNLKGAERVKPCPAIPNARASRGKARLIKSLAQQIKKAIKKEEYEPKHGAPRPPRKPDDYNNEGPDRNADPNAAVLGIKEMGELRSVNYPDFVLGAGKGDDQADLTKGSSPYGKILIVQGFAGEDSVSLNLPELCMYLRHENGRLVPSRYQDNDLWKQDASFYEHGPLDNRGSASLSLESVNYSGHFIRHYKGKFEIGTPDSRPGTPFNADATFNWLR